MASETIPSTEDMDLENPQTVSIPEDTDVNSKRDRDEEGNDDVSKKAKVNDDDEEEKSVEEERMEKEKEEEENSGPVILGPKTFGSSTEMFDYFYKFLHQWHVNIKANKYEYMVLLDLIKKGHPEPDKKIGSGINAFEIRYHPMWKSRCFFAIRDDKTVEDFSFRKCVDHILPLPDNIKNKFDANNTMGGGGRRGGGGGRGRGRGRGGKSRR